MNSPDSNLRKKRSPQRQSRYMEVDVQMDYKNFIFTKLEITASVIQIKFSQNW